jgi:triosephosphate isomerase
MADRTTLVAGNWKMNTTADDAVNLARDIVKAKSSFGNTEVLLCPPFVWLGPVGEVIKNSGIKLGAQNMYWEDKGAFTGEISPAMLKSAGCQYVIIGHSERRQFFGETDETINKKLFKAVQAGLTPVVCLGESLQIRESGRTDEIITGQFEKCFKDFNDFDKIVIAYEPVWAIGTGKTATKEQAQQVHHLLRTLLAKITDAAERVRILYGGSVKPDNAADLIAMPDIDGFLVGGASLKALDFVGIISRSSPERA